MEFVKIQDAKTLEIIQWRVNGLRVSKLEYNYQLALRIFNDRSCHLTEPTKRGNFRHSFYTN